MYRDPRHWLQIIWGFIALFWLLSALSSKRVVRTQPVAGRLLHSVILIAAAFLLFSDGPYLPWRAQRVLPAAPPVAWLGLTITALGALFTVIARAYLGRNWNARPSLKEDHEVIHSGPYALVRHPIYSGLLLTATGTAVAIGLVRSFLALPLILLGFWIKASYEERLLTEALGEPYRAYTRAVRWAIIPFLL
ncbi:MAG TPA: isoprenylcysteine carboxylmethyltransferase family protein [Thermoanaerobaculia bacterium]|nr:isoprenylcysteine carboxylmethyltransferase family protein [Thermoanaerobaculia bacterium]